MRSELYLSFLCGSWLLGIPVTWAYLVAYTFTIDKELVGIAIVFGWVVSIFWPFILMVQAWLTWWF